MPLWVAPTCRRADVVSVSSPALNRETPTLAGRGPCLVCVGQEATAGQVSPRYWPTWVTTLAIAAKSLPLTPACVAPETQSPWLVSTTGAGGATPVNVTAVAAAPQADDAGGATHDGHAEQRRTSIVGLNQQRTIWDTLSQTSRPSSLCRAATELLNVCRVRCSDDNSGSSVPG